MKNAIFPLFPNPGDTCRNLIFRGARILLIFFLTLCFVSVAPAQRPARAEVTLVTNISELADGIDFWLDSHDDILFSHSNIDETQIIHNTANFLPWHRVHIRELEAHLLEEGIDLQGEVLPRWRPRADAGEPGNPIPELLRVTNGGASGVDNPDPISPIFPGNIVPPDACTAYSSAALFSNALQGGYHDNTHGLVGGAFAPLSSSATVLGFWPWHAWVDEFWYNWENTCTTGYTKFPPAGSTEIIIDSEVTWSGQHYVKGQVIITDGGRLNIAPGAVIHFRSSDYEAYETSIVVKPGGLLYIDNATLRGIDYFGPSSEQIRYNSGWKGIRVEGVGSFIGNHGHVSVLNNSVIEHASNGIESVDGGRIVARNSTFRDNRQCLYIHNFNFNNHYQFYIQDCTFDVTAPLRDVTWTPDGGLPRRHFKHSIPETPERYIYLEDVKSVKIISGSFNKSEVITGETTTGIVAVNARFSCTEDATFAQSLDLGISVLNTVSGPYGAPLIDDCTFNSKEGILLNGADYVTISYNRLNNAVSGIEAKASSAYDILDNIIDGGAGAVSVLSDASSSNHANIIERNIFTGGERQLQFQVDNPDVQFKCNTFNTPGQYSVALSSGSLPPQGSCVAEPAGNIWDACVNLQSHLYKDINNAQGYVYSCHSDREPICVSQDITVSPCNYAYIENPTCEIGPPCLTCPDFPEEDDIAGLEAQKQTWAGSALPPQEIAAIIWRLGWEQKIIAQRGLLRVMEADSTLALAHEYLDEVGTVFSFPASDRIGLYLSNNELAAANSLIAALPEGHEKTLFSLLSTLKSEGRSYRQITPAEEQTIRTIAQGSDQSAAQAKSILYAAFGEKITIEPEPVGSGGKPASETVATQSPALIEASLIFMPNPAPDAATVQYKLEVAGGTGMFTLTDLFGRQMLAQRFDATVSEGQFSISLNDLPSGTYIGTITIDGQRQLVSKLAIVK